MADIIRTVDRAGDKDVVTWESLTDSDAAGTYYKPGRARAAIAAVQFTGTFDSATAVLEGSNDGTSYVTLRNSQDGTAVSFTAAGYAEISTAMQFIRPSTSGGGASQDIDCILVARG